MKIAVSKPDISSLEKEYVNKALDSGWISSQGDFIPKFEEAWANYNSYKYGVACSSGTTALTIALRALGIKHGDEVIVPEFTMIATAWAVSYLGATPVFVDCGTDLNIDVTKIEEKITDKTKAIMPVNIYGRQTDRKAIRAIAHDYNLYIVEDCAESHGVPPYGDIACYSLFANKIITAGEGGVCLTNDPRLAEQMKHLRGMAFDTDHTFLHKKLGYNYRMTNMQGALALAQVERIDELLEKRNKIEFWYDKYLPEGFLTRPRDVLWFYDILAFDHRDKLRDYLKKTGIETRLFFKPMSMQPMYYNENYKKLLAYKYAQEGLYLPTHSGMLEEEVKHICLQLTNFTHSL